MVSHYEKGDVIAAKKVVDVLGVDRWTTDNNEHWIILDKQPYEAKAHNSSWPDASYVIAKVAFMGSEKWSVTGEPVHLSTYDQFLWANDHTKPPVIDHVDVATNYQVTYTVKP